MESWLVLSAVACGLRLVSLPRLQGWLDRLADRLPGRRPADPAVLVRLVDAARRYHPLRPRCLERSLTLAFLLRRSGQPVDLRIGVRREADRLRAHAWLEQGGRPLGEAPELLTRFAPLAEQEGA